MVAISRCLAVALTAAELALAHEIRGLHPFEECTVDELPQRLGPPAGEVVLTALRHDWAHRSLALVASPGEERVSVTLSLEGAPELRQHVRLRVVGFVKQTPIGWVMDPIFDRPGEIDPAWSEWIRNLDLIRAFPTVSLTPANPVVLWLTADTRGLGAGRYEGQLVVAEAQGGTRRLAVRLVVEPFELQADNPLICQGWQWIPGAPTKLDGARVFFDYGINATHVEGDMEACRAAGYRFFIFTFGPTWKGKTPEEVPSEELDRAIAGVKAKVDALGLQPDEWALYTIDEPNDTSVANQARWCRLLRQKWPEARFLFNPGWGPGPKNEWGTVDGTVRPLAPFADVWCPYSAWLSDEAAGVSLPIMKQARQVWFYEIMNFPYTRKPSVGRSLIRTLPWVAWKYGLQGCSWYSLNAISRSPYADDPEGTEYAASYYTVPARSLEALREGLQEYKRMAALRRLGADEKVLGSFTERAMSAQDIRSFDALRRDMDDLILRLSAQTR